MKVFNMEQIEKRHFLLELAGEIWSGVSASAIPGKHDNLQRTCLSDIYWTIRLVAIWLTMGGVENRYVILGVPNNLA
jgi:hypothetical protein